MNRDKVQDVERKASLAALTGVGRVWLLNVALICGAGAIYLGVVQDLPRIATPLHLPWPLIAAMFVFAEIYVVHLEFRREAHSFSLSELPLVLGLFFLEPGHLVLAQMVGSFLALAIFRRQSLLKLVFNLGHFFVEVCLAAIVFQAILGQGDPLGPEGWLATFAAAIGATVVGVVSVVLAISLSDAEFDFNKIPQMALFSVTITVTNTSLALAGAMIFWLEPRAAWLLLVPTAILFVTYRLYISERQKHDSIETLYQSTRAVQSTLKIDATGEALLRQARRMLRAEVAELILLPDRPGGTELVSTLGMGDELQSMEPTHLDPRKGIWARVASEAKPMLLPRPMVDSVLSHYFAKRGIRDVMAAPLQRDGVVIGTMMVANRMGDVSTFDEEDLKLFETLVNHASVAIENSRLVSQLEDSLAHLTEMNQLKDDFVASVSHELRTPLTSIQGYVKTLLRPEVDFSTEDRRTFLEAVDRQSDRLRRLIEDLLVVSRLEGKGEKPKVAPFSMYELVDQVAEDLRDRARLHSLRIDTERNLPMVQNDAGKVQQIVGNLVENALKYTPPKSDVIVKTERQGKGVLISVIDNGAGIPEDSQEKIFERFFQIDQTATRAVGGTGLGLYICRKLAYSVGGHLWLERSDAQGSTFCLWIPFEPSGDMTEVSPETPGEILPMKKGKLGA